MYKKRRNALKQAVMGKQINAVLIDSPSNLYYYTGFTGGEAVFVMPLLEELYAKGDDRDADTSNMYSVTGTDVITSDEHSVTGTGVITLNMKSGEEIDGYIITDSRYYEQVEKECPGLTLVRLEKKEYGEIVRELLDTLFSGASTGKGMRGERPAIAVEESMTLARYLKLQEICNAYEFEASSKQINASRMIKDEEELCKIRRAEEIGDAAFSYILDVIKPGITETEIALELEFFMKKQGASRLSFDTIVSSGPNSSMPHAQVTDRKIQNGDFVTMDFGCVYKGYCSDMTRTIAVGNPSDEMRKIYQIVLDANLRAMEGIREGVDCREIDAIARDYIKKQGYGDYFGHGLGHGVGLDIHEEPRFSPKCEVMTRENMVITDEPGIYLPGRFGVRIEDLVVVKKNGYEKLSQSPKELIIL